MYCTHFPTVGILLLLVTYTKSQYKIQLSKTIFLNNNYLKNIVTIHFLRLNPVILQILVVY